MLLAAGQGSRLGRPKALVEIGGMTLAERGVALLRDGGADPVVMVTGAAPVSLPGVITAHNPDWQTGMGSSLREGLETLPADRDAVVIALVDQPLIGPEAVRRLIAAFPAGAEVAVACYAGPAAQPGADRQGALGRSRGCGAGRRRRARHSCAHVRTSSRAVECGDVGRPDDLDTQEDLVRITALISGRGRARRIRD